MINYTMTYFDGQQKSIVFCLFVFKFNVYIYYMYVLVISCV